MAPIDPSLAGDEAPAHGEDIEDTMATGVVPRADGKGCFPTLEESRGKDGDPLQHPFVRAEAERPASPVPRMEASERQRWRPLEGTTWRRWSPPL